MSNLLDLDTTTGGDKYLVTANPTSIGFGITNPPSQSIVFQDNVMGEVGRLTWEDGLMTFTGNADASAKMFFDAVCQMFNLNQKENIT